MNNNWTNEINSVFPECPQHPICGPIFFSQTVQPHCPRMKKIKLTDTLRAFTDHIVHRITALQCPTENC